MAKMMVNRDLLATKVSNLTCLNLRIAKASTYEEQLPHMHGHSYEPEF